MGETWGISGPAFLFFYTLDREANYWVNIDKFVEKKIEAALSHVSQFEPAVNKYRPDWTPADRAKARAELVAAMKKRNGHTVEAYRLATEFNQQ